MSDAAATTGESCKIHAVSVPAAARWRVQGWRRAQAAMEASSYALVSIGRLSAFVGWREVLNTLRKFPESGSRSPAPMPDNARWVQPRATTASSTLGPCPNYRSTVTTGCLCLLTTYWQIRCRPAVWTEGRAMFCSRSRVAAQLPCMQRHITKTVDLVVASPRRY